MDKKDQIFFKSHQDSRSRARTGQLVLPHGTVITPAFMPVGTNATVKAMTKDWLDEIGFQIILANTYHLYLRPGVDTIRSAGGLHGFSGWQKNFLTDSGGFQVFSLSSFRKITREGVRFRSHIDGSSHFLTPEIVVGLQEGFNSDIQMQLDVCTGYGTEWKKARDALTITSDWAKRAKKTWMDTPDTYQGKLFAIVQGNFYTDLREESIDFVTQLDTPGIAIGGLSVGEPPEVYSEYLEFTATRLPHDKPRYVMGIGTPDYILDAVLNGIDIFDCVLPSRNARNGSLFTRDGCIAIKKEKYAKDFSPIDPECKCKVCREYSRAYLRHLYKNDEILSSMLATYHNLAFLHQFMNEIRIAIENNTFLEYRKSFLSRYQGSK
ncbi:MAG TPA: tRNA guanosine(34) transglycosylase Tgt [Treponemataceae bacterium]|jgi:queuine tRNA-ribosyltransferase|nr:tRNA guanosine(34) transglycosylase Tgt [Treponemataceae bacterium]